MKKVILLISLIQLFGCKSVILNDKEKHLLGFWSQEMRSEDSTEWEFNKKGILNVYNNGKISNASFYYKVLDLCPAECENYISKWHVENYLLLREIENSNETKCYEIIFEEDKTVSIRYLPLERDTYEVLKKK